MVKGVEIDTVKRIRGGGGFKSEPKKRKSQKEVQKNFYKTASPLRFSSLFLIFREKAKKKVKRSFSKICAGLRPIVHTGTIDRIYVRARAAWLAVAAARNHVGVADAGADRVKKSLGAKVQ